jgi:hypothetical protein
MTRTLIPTGELGSLLKEEELIIPIIAQSGFM